MTLGSQGPMLRRVAALVVWVLIASACGGGGGDNELGGDTEPAEDPGQADSLVEPDGDESAGEDGEGESASGASPTGNGCLNNTIEFRSDTDDGSYFDAQRYYSTVSSQEEYLSRDGGEWVGEVPVPVVGSRLSPNYGLLWSIEVHYPDEAVTEWKESETTGNRYAVFRGKHVPAGPAIDYEAQTENQLNTHVSKTTGDRSQDWQIVEDQIDFILGEPFDWYPETLTRNSADREIVEKLAGWIKNYRLEDLMGPFGGAGGSNVDGALHPADFLSSHPSFCQGAASTLTEMMAHLGIPARLGETEAHAWTEVLVDGEWLYVDNQPETFLHSQSPLIPVWEYQGRAGFQPQTEEGWNEARQRSAVIDGSLIDIMADPESFDLVEGVNVYPWFFNWSNPLVYQNSGEPMDSMADLTYRPEVFSDGVYNLYDCSYGTFQNVFQDNQSCPAGGGRSFAVAQRLNSTEELAALYPGRTDDLPYVAARDDGDDPNVMHLTAVRNHSFLNNSPDEAVRVDSGDAVRKQFRISDTEGVSEVYAVLYLGPDGQADLSGIPADGGDWYFDVNGSRTMLADLGGFAPAGDAASGGNGIETNYLGLGQTVYRFKLNLDDLHQGAEGCLI